MCLISLTFVYPPTWCITTCPFPGCTEGFRFAARINASVSISSVGLFLRIAFKSTSPPDNRQERNFPSEVKRSRLQVPQKGWLTPDTNHHVPPAPLIL